MLTGRMRSGYTAWLTLAVMLLIVASAADYAIFVYRQRHGDVLSFTTVRQFVATPLKNGRYEYNYLGTMDIACVQAFLPHQKMSPCWWVVIHHDHWE